MRGGVPSPLPSPGVLGMLDLLRLTALSSEQAQFVRVMQGSAEGLMQVLNEILDFTKISAGHLTLEETEFSLGDLLEQTSALFQTKINERGLTFRLVHPPQKERAVRGDANRLRQVGWPSGRTILCFLLHNKGLSSSHHSSTLLYVHVLACMHVCMYGCT